MSEPKRVKKAFRQGSGPKQSRIGDARIMGWHEVSESKRGQEAPTWREGQLNGLEPEQGEEDIHVGDSLGRVSSRVRIPGPAQVRDRSTCLGQEAVAVRRDWLHIRTLI